MHNDDMIPNPPSAENTDSSTVPPNSDAIDFAADADRQGIFSSSDTRIETENLPEVPEVVWQAPMSSITPTLRTESTVTGDLKLGGTSKKKKWPLFVALGAVAVVIGLAMLLSLHATKSGEPENIEEAFNRFANYYLFNEDSDTEPFSSLP